MISKRYINGKEVPVYSIGQLAARIERHPGTLRKLQREGFLYEPTFRDERNGYRLYTIHEVNIIAFVFAKFTLQRGVKFPAEAKYLLQSLMEALHKHYEDDTSPIPAQAYTDAQRNVMLGEQDAPTED